MAKDVEGRTENRQPLRQDFEINPELVKNFPGALNNFYCSCPGGMRRIPETTDEVDLASHLEKLRTTFRDFCRDNRIEFGESDHYSNVYLDETREQFFRKIDLAIESVGLNGEEVKDWTKVIGNLHGEFCEAMNGRLPKYAEEIIEAVCFMAKQRNKMLVPVYLKMREWGYTHQELAE